MKLFLIAFILVTACFAVILQCKWFWTVKKAKKKGIYPDAKKATLFHVRQLIIQGQNDLAIALYCQIFKTSFNKANQAVLELEDSIKNKKGDI